MQTLGLSPSTPKTTSRLRELLWPDVSEEVGARTAAYLAMWASFLIAGLTSLFVLLGMVPKASWVDVVLFVAIGLGVRKMSRFAAVAGLGLYVLEQLATRGVGVVTIIVTFLFISAVRGTFGYQRQRRRRSEEMKRTPGPPEPVPPAQPNA